VTREQSSQTTSVATHYQGRHKTVVTPRARLLEYLLALLLAVAAVISGLNMVEGDKTLAVLPLVAMVALGLGALALTRFSGFVLLLLGIRPSLDLLKLSGTGTGTAVGNTAVDRGLDPSSILGVLFLLAAMVWLAAQARSGRLVKSSRLTVAFVAFAAAGALSVVGSGHPEASALEVLRIITVAMMLIVLEQLITTREMMIRVIVTCYIGLLFPLVYTVFGIVTGSPASEVKGNFTRLTGPFNQSNTFARYLAFLIVFGIAIYPIVKPKLRVWFAGLLGLASVFMLLTLTRTGILGMAIAMVVLAFVQRRKGLVIGLVGAALAAMILVPGLGDRFGTFSEPAETATGDPSGNTLEWRLRYWTEVLPLANENPVTGIGLTETQFQTESEKQPHSDFVRAYVETGLIGFAAYVTMLIALVGNARRALQRSVRGTMEHAVAAGSLATAVTFVLGSMFANLMSNVVSLWYLFAFAACASYISRIGAQQAATNETVDEPAPAAVSDGRSAEV
jgi:O-antigen ligase